jgi:hypothetical protein
MPVNLCHAFQVDEEVLMFVVMTCPIKGGRCCGDTCPQKSPKTHLHTLPYVQTTHLKWENVFVFFGEKKKILSSFIKHYILSFTYSYTHPIYTYISMFLIFNFLIFQIYFTY